MAKKTSESKSRGPRKESRTFRITAGRIEAAQKILGTTTATATIETALDMVLFRDELVEGAKRTLGLDIDPV